jgi:D-alanine-D-alanine ligase
MYQVAILANLKKNAPHAGGLAADAWADLDSERTIDGLRAALEAEGHRVTFLEADRTLLDTIRQVNPDICFNLAEGHHGDSREAQVPALLEMLQIRFTGSKILTHAISLDKAMTKRIWQTFGLATAPWQVFTAPEQPLDQALRFPLFVKPLSEGTGIGISTQSVVQDLAALNSRVAYTLETYRQPALVERYLSGREVTVGVIGNGAEQVILPPVQIDTTQIAPEEQGVYSNRMKTEFDETHFLYIPDDLPPEMVLKVQRLAQDGFNAIGALDVSRLDIRFDDQGEPFLLEINTLPGMSKGFSDLCICVDRAGLDYQWLVQSVLNSALRRYGLDAPPLNIPERLRLR